MGIIIGSVIKCVTHKSRHLFVELLKATIKAAIMEMNREALKGACVRFRSKMEAVVQATKDYIK